MIIKKILVLVALALLSEPAFAATHESKMGTWVSVPRAAISIVVDETGARIIGPGWERQFTVATNKPVRIDLDESSWFELQLRPSGAWEGTYFHPAVRPEEQGQLKRHLMLLTPLSLGGQEQVAPVAAAGPPGAQRSDSRSCATEGC